MTEVLSIRSYQSGRPNDRAFNESIIDCYSEVFAGPPWNERWERSDVAAMLETLGLPMNTIALEGETVVGFAFAKVGYVDEFERQLGISFAAEVAKRRYGAWDPEFVLYQSDIGVLDRYRGKGLGKRLFRERLRGNQQAYQVVRTRQYPKPSVTYAWYTQKLGYEVVARYPEEDGRVILFQRGKDLAERLGLNGF